MSVVMKSRKTPVLSVGILAIALTFSACATKHEVAPTVVTMGPDRPGAGSALVYVYRLKKRMGWSAPYPIRDRGAEIGRVRAGEYFSYRAEPGEHAFTATTDGSNQQRIELASKQTYYLRVDEEEEFYVTPPHLTVVDPEKAASGIEHLTRVGASGQ